MSAVVRWFWSQLPKRKMVIRAALCGVMGTLPLLFAATVQRWYVVLPLLAMIGMGVYKSGVGEDVRKQLRWMSRMSQRGPVFSLLRLVGRLYVRGKRRLYGDALDVLPLPPSVVGPSVRSTNAVMLKWLVKPHSAYSVERYEVQLRPKAGAAADWQQLAAALEEAKHAAGGLVPDTEYLVRVRAHNSKGKSEWCEAGFRTKQEPVDGGGVGPGYSWAQGGRRGEELTARVALPAGTRAKQLSVSVMPTKLAVSLLPPSLLPAERRPLLEGELFAAVRADEVEWEVVDAEVGAGGEAGGAGGKQLKLSLLKKEPQGPFWPCLVRGHPEVETSGMKREPMSTEQIMEQMHELGGMGGLEGVPGMPGMMGMGGGMGMGCGMG